MTVAHFIDDLGILLFLKPMSNFTNIELLNILDDLGIFFVCKPLRYLQRFAEYTQGVDSRSTKSLKSSWSSTLTYTSVTSKRSHAKSLNSSSVTYTSATPSLSKRSHADVKSLNPSSLTHPLSKRSRIKSLNSQRSSTVTGSLSKI